MNLRTILFSQYPALFLLAVLFLIAHLRVRKRSAVKAAARARYADSRPVKRGKGSAKKEKQ